ncbi:iron uptake transporter deferrochelatase/peroxidase subunit [Amphritea sp. 2_MG-2023]|uniref:iron uptake transporter deferrochelatase/peroxidase subunit n=1 Tax=Amphritea TaxID=515417 RepID=UPI001C067181|nr:MULTISPECIES: iron uptake transporter deferrochelatase/peroxidase subunit [Amphritea]MBU2966326.1 deferrochelatase/peroxidase EfeB [Amphritea atlantica]MDO6419765.1 iron uptake transporter deferrochelatase/peroxidase subunit [Amphritea sp. 2_MG-2023]
MTSKRLTHAVDEPSSLSRRRLLKGAAIGGSGLLFGKAIAAQTSDQPQPTRSTDTTQSIPFYGEHQAGITTPAQRHVYFMVLKLDNTDRQAVIKLFKEWTRQAALLTQGKNIGPYSNNHFIPPADTGEADSLHAYNLSLTFGVSPSFLEKLGLQDKAPAEFKPLPHFPRDQLQAQYTGGDICIQSCADDPQVAFHAIRQLVRHARTSMVSMLWAQNGFNAYNDVSQTPRNLFAFKDGTANALTLKDAEKYIWVDDKNWLQGGSYMVVRRIQMHLETWDRTSYGEQENTFGRDKLSGAPMGQQHEFEPIDTGLKESNGDPVMPVDSHVHLAHRTGQQLLRRSYSYTGGINTLTSQYDAGLLFISFQKSPQQFITIQNAFGKIDKMNEYITHVGSGLFACFPGVKEGDYLGQALLEG